MADKYPGLCVGGPLAGKLFTGRTQVHKVEERPPLKSALQASLAQAPLMDMPEITSHTYHWIHIGPFALWVHETLNRDQALHALAQAYEDQHRV